MASTVIPLSDRPLAERAFIALNRRANAQRRYPVVLLDEDMEALDDSTGGRRRSHDALRQLTADGRLRQVRRGAYVLGAPTGGSDARLLAILDAVTPRPYLVTAGRALAETGLSDQHFFRVVVLAAGRLAEWSWQGEQVYYVESAPDRIWGELGPDGPAIARPERAILDCLADRRFGVSLPQTAEAIDRAMRIGMPLSRLVKATRRYETAAVSRRLGFLVELLVGADAAAPFLRLRGASNKYVPLSPFQPAKGPADSTWRVHVNIEPELLLAHRITG
jgi:predicted transcriptional regulator of viral defense system